jgi:hypothetical protein
MRVEKYETYDFQPLVRVEYQGMQKRYETTILMFLPIASGHNLSFADLCFVDFALSRSISSARLIIQETRSQSE